MKKPLVQIIYNPNFLEEKIGTLAGTKMITGNATMQDQMKEAYIVEQLRVRKAEYSIEENLSVYLVTFNGGGKKPKLPPDPNISQLFTGASTINPISVDTMKTSPDIYIFCMQEVCALNAKTLFSKSENSKIWEEFLYKHLNEFTTKREKDPIEYEKVKYHNNIKD